jgi:hypothetical protein
VSIDWLLASEDPGVLYRTLTDLLGRPEDDPEVKLARDAIPDGPKVRALLRGLEPDGRFGVEPYRKWDGGHWRLVALADLRYPARAAVLERIVDTELAWAAGLEVRWVAGRARRHASQEGNAVGAVCRLGYEADPRVGALVDRLVECQWLDGGWNCDARREARHSSFHESIAPLWGLAEYRRATGDPAVDGVIDRAAEMFLRAGMFRSERRREVLRPQFLSFRYPPYWHYDVLYGLRVMTDIGRVGDPRAAEAVDLVESHRRPDGTWAASGSWWKTVGGSSYPEAVAWTRSGPNEMVTFHALRVLRAAGRID